MKNTKESRNQVRTYLFDSLTKKGYAREDYKDVVIFTKEIDGKFFLEAYAGSSTKNLNKYYYRDAKRLQEVIDGLKKSTDRIKAYKAERKTNPIKRGAAAASAAIKAELKSLYPNVKFSVRSETFAGGDSVHISYCLGPDSKVIEEICSKYQYGHFNGMEDIYESTNQRNDLPQAKYVSVNHEIDQNLRYRMAQMLSDEMSFQGVPKLNSEQDFFSNFSERFGSAWSWCDLIRQNVKFWNFNASDPSKIVLIEVKNDRTINYGYYFIYSVDGILYDTREYTAPKIEQTTPPAEKIDTIEKEIVIINFLQIVDYSEKAIAVIGNTKPIKDLLGSLGGRFNSHLKCGAGWFFSKSKQDIVKDAIFNASK